MKPAAPMDAVVAWVEVQRSAMAAWSLLQAWRRHMADRTATYRDGQKPRTLDPLAWLRTYLTAQGLSTSFITAAEGVHRRQLRAVNRWLRTRQHAEALTTRLAIDEDRLGADHPTTARTRAKLEQLRAELM
jgi:hypothetical protein